MSRTSKRGKGPGYEYWGTRGGRKMSMATPGRASKTFTHRIERQRNNAEARKGVARDPD